MMKTLLHDSPGWWCVCMYVLFFFLSFTGLHACTSTSERLKCYPKNPTSVFLIRWQCGRWCVCVRCDNRVHMLLSRNGLQWQHPCWVLFWTMMLLLLVVLVVLVPLAIRRLLLQLEMFLCLCMAAEVWKPRVGYSKQWLSSVSWCLPLFLGGREWGGVSAGEDLCQVTNNPPFSCGSCTNSN